MPAAAFGAVGLAQAAAMLCKAFQAKNLGADGRLHRPSRAIKNAQQRLWCLGQQACQRGLNHYDTKAAPPIRRVATTTVVTKRAAMKRFITSPTHCSAKKRPCEPLHESMCAP